MRQIIELNNINTCQHNRARVPSCHTQRSSHHGETHALKIITTINVLNKGINIAMFDTSSDSDDDTMVAWVEEESEWTMSQWVTILNVGINGFTSLVLCLISKTVAASCSLFTQWLLCNIIGSIGSSKADLTRWLKGTNSLLICHANHFNNTSHLGISLEFLKHLFPVTLWLVLFWIVH